MKFLAIIGSSLFFVFGLITAEISVSQLKSYMEKVERQCAADLSSNLRSILESKINTTLQLDGLKAYIIAKNGILTSSELNAVLANLYYAERNIRNITVSPDNQMQYIYPVAGNEAAIGIKFSDLPLQWPMVKRAMEERKPNIAGPFQLIEGGSGLVYRVPIFMVDNSYWGLIGIVINTDAFFSFIKPLITNSGIEVALRGRDGKGEHGEVFFGNFSLFRGDNVFSNITLPADSSWQLAIKPAPINLNDVLLFRVGITLLIALLSVLFFLGLNIWVRNQQLRKQLSKITATVPGLVYQLRLNSDGNYNFLFVSEGITDLFGLSPEDLKKDASRIFEIIHPDDYQATVVSIQKSVSNLTSWHHQFRSKLEDGSIKWLVAQAIPEPEDQGSSLWCGTITDITETKNIQHSFHENEQVLTESQRIARIGSWSLDIESDYLKWSDEMYIIHGVSKEAFGHTSAAFIELVHPEDQSDMEHWKNNFIQDGIQKETDFRIILPNGTVRFIRSTSQLQHNAKNQVQFIAGIIQDITERKYREQVDKEHLDQLAHVTRLGLMGELASGIAHEVNQPLTAIATYAQVSLNMIKKENPDLLKLGEVMVKTQEQALRTGQIIHRMKRFCTAKAQQRSTVNINALINECVSLCADPLKQNSIELSLELADNLPFIHIDHIQIEQVIINLIRNSIDAILGVTDRQHGQINIKSHLTDNNEIQVSIKDNGPGIEQHQQANILMPFHTTKENGMGMGLSISRSLIEAHNGKMSFNSDLGMGCVFYFTLPISIA